MFTRFNRRRKKQNVGSKCAPLCAKYKQNVIVSWEAKDTIAYKSDCRPYARYT